MEVASPDSEPCGGTVVGVLVDARQTKAPALERTLRSLLAQSFGCWRLWLLTTDVQAGALSDGRVEQIEVGIGDPIIPAARDAVAASTCVYIVQLNPGDELKPDALSTVIQAFSESATAELVYTDSDRVLPDGTLTDPFFKPDWSPTLLMCFDYVSGLACYRRDTFLRAVSGVWSPNESVGYGLVLRVNEANAQVLHVQRPLISRAPASAAHASAVEKADRRALTGSWARRGRLGTVAEGRFRGAYRFRPLALQDPRVDILIPTRDKVDLLKRCIEGIRTRSSYRNFTLTILDNESVQPETLDYLASFPGRVFRYPHPFNFARIMNLGARASEGDYLLLLNNDCEVMTPDWIETMLEHCERPEVGAVGIRLLYPDGSIHHEGITLNRHNATVAHIKFEGYFGLGLVAREVSAVTAACVMTKPGVFSEVGGFDERMRIGYNDVDFCLRLRERGYSIIYTGDAEMHHITGASRGRALPLKDEWYFLERWRLADFKDPYFSPNLTRSWPVGTGWA
jgi:O-antigen biosynthesis protein